MINERDHESTRIEVFSDATFAFAATLLVISLGVPRQFSELYANLRGFLPFALSFAALYLVWVAHTNLFRRYRLGDGYSILLNGILLFTVLFYVYPLKFIATAVVTMFTGQVDVVMDRDQVPSLYIIFGIGWAVVFLCISLLYRHAHTIRERLGLAPVHAYDAETHSRYYLTFVIAGLLSILVAWLGIGLAWGLPALMYATAALMAAYNRKVRRKGRDELATQVAEHPQLAYTGAIRTDEIQQLLK